MAEPAGRQGKYQEQPCPQQLEYRRDGVIHRMKDWVSECPGKQSQPGPRRQHRQQQGQQPEGYQGEVLRRLGGPGKGQMPLEHRQQFLGYLALRHLKKAVGHPAEDRLEKSA